MLAWLIHDGPFSAGRSGAARVGLVKLSNNPIPIRGRCFPLKVTMGIVRGGDQEDNKARPEGGEGVATRAASLSGSWTKWYIAKRIE